MYFSTVNLHRYVKPFLMKETMTNLFYKKKIMAANGLELQEAKTAY